ncbi:MAG TPA: hypothetical protein VNC78_07290 [Actinomycetota bacterium]|nr:hypothetical protein [Actinomycetota bacterium]
MRAYKVGASVVAVAVVLGAIGAPAGARRRHAPLDGEGVGLELIANIEYAGGTDMEFITTKGRDYALTGAAPGVGGAEAGAMRIIDVTDPEKPFLAATLECSLYQMDIQVSHDQKTAIMAADSAGGPDACLGVGLRGFMTVDISNPLKPKPAGFADIANGSHNTTAHPKKPFVYNSSSGENPGVIDIWSIKNPKKPELVGSYTNLPSAPHDISFSDDGKMAVVAGGGKNIEILDTTDPSAPTLLTKSVCAGCSLAHDGKFTPDGTHVIIGDEAAGGGTFPCPGGALYFYELNRTPPVPVLVPIGIYEPEEVVFAAEGQTAPASCTSHVMDVSPDGTHLAVSWYSAGTRYLDITNMTGVTIGANGNGVKEVGWFIPEGGDSWSSKFYKGPYIYSNDILRGFDVFKISD